MEITKEKKNGKNGHLEDLPVKELKDLSEFMANQRGRDLLFQFCKGNKDEGILKFVQEVKKFKECSPDERISLAKEIHKKFLAGDAEIPLQFEGEETTNGKEQVENLLKASEESKGKIQENLFDVLNSSALNAFEKTKWASFKQFVEKQEEKQNVEDAESIINLLSDEEEQQEQPTPKKVSKMEKSFTSIIDIGSLSQQKLAS